MKKMAAKKSTKSTKTKSRVSAKSSKGGLKFRWWMAVVLVLIVGGIGIAVARYSLADSEYDHPIGHRIHTHYPDFVSQDSGFSWGDFKTCMNLRSSGRWCSIGRSKIIKAPDGSHALLWGRKGDYRCATIYQRYVSGAQSKFAWGGERNYFRVPTEVVVVEWDVGVNACEV